MAEIEPQNGSDNTPKSSPAVAFSSFKPQLVVEASMANDAVQFYKSAFGAEELGRTTLPKRKADQELPSLLSADLKLASSIFSVSSSSDDSSLQSSGSAFCLETEDVEAAIAKAVTAGALSVDEGKVKDPYGFVWMISSSAKNISDAASTMEA